VSGDWVVPHLIVEYSANLEGQLKLDGLLDALHAEALETGIFPLGGLRVRAFRADHYRIADLHPDNAYVHVTALVGAGRPLDVRERAAAQLFDRIRTELASLSEAGPLAISFNMQEFDAVLNFKHNNLHRYVRSRVQGD
jgi:5-carboxymethyl-2-hydroxymuconate isomerase